MLDSNTQTFYHNHVIKNELSQELNALHNINDVDNKFYRDRFWPVPISIVE